MSLAPDARVLLTDALRPPIGFHLDIAIGTTYTLDLTALLMAPLAFAVADHATTEEPATVDPILLLEAVRRHADRTTVFVQAGGIAVPSTYRSILTFIEDSVHEVEPPRNGGIFHPKIWALRFVDGTGVHRHRLVVLSRNLTFDRSWDTALVLDEAPAGTIDASPAATFVRALPALAVAGLSDARRALLDELCQTLAGVRFAPPIPFTGGTLFPIGLSNESVWPFPGRATRMLAISPFLTARAVRRLGDITPERTLLSRAESLDALGTRALDGWRIRTLQPVIEDDQAASATNAGDETGAIPGTTPRDGLHAKTFILDLPQGRSLTLTGSANLTTASWERNVEFDAALVGATADCGVERTLGADGLAATLAEYAVTSEAGEGPATLVTEREIEHFHRELAAARPVLHVEAGAADEVTVRLELSAPASPGETRVWPASLSPTQGRILTGSETWTIAAKNLTPFLAVETTAGSGPARTSSRCVVMAELFGDLGDRRAHALRDILASKGDVLRYLVFLLGIDPSDGIIGSGASAREGAFGGAGSTERITLFEPLVRALGHDTDALGRVASLVDELRAMPDGADLIPESFDELWDVVWQVHREVQS